MLGVIMATCFCLLLYFAMTVFASFAPFVPKAFRVSLDALVLVRLTFKAILVVINLTSSSLVYSNFTVHGGALFLLLSLPSLGVPRPSLGLPLDLFLPSCQLLCCCWPRRPCTVYGAVQCRRSSCSHRFHQGSLLTSF